MIARKVVILLGTLCVMAALAPSAQADFGFASLDGGAFDSLGNPDNQAGSHPHVLKAEFSFNTIPYLPPEIPELPAGDVKDITTILPPGLIADPTAVPACSSADFATSVGGAPACSPDTRVGTIDLTIGDNIEPPQPAEIYNLTRDYGTPAKLGFWLASVPVVLRASLSPTPPYNAIIRVVNTAQIVPVFASRVVVWGVPADPSHNAERGGPSAAPRLPFASLPTSCAGPIKTDFTITSWLGGTDSGSFFSHGPGGPNDLLGIEGCDELDFAPTLAARPTTNVADSPSGLDVDLKVPQSEDPDGKAVAHLRDTTVTLPEGLAVNPSSANGLDGCSPAEVDLQGPDPARCPAASKVATVEVDTPLVDHPIPGAAYIADPYDNPFNSLIALYIALEDPETSTVVKLAGEVSADPSTGQLRASFEDNPQVPFEHFRLHFKSGPHATLRTPATCGDYTTTSSLTPWSAPDSGPPETPSDTWSISQSPGGSCAGSPAELPHAPAFEAGSITPIAAAHSPFVVKLRRADGSQNFAAVTLSPPQGLLAKLAGTASCSDAALAAAAQKTGREEQASPSCPLASKVGSATAGAGAGPSPYYASGRVYLSGPYKGAPYSLAIVTPATAGPFDLGTIVVKTALYVNSKTAEVTAVSDPIPQILQGIPLDVRSVDVSLDKPSFTLNPTSCDPMAVTGLLTSNLGRIAPLQSRFQVAECGRLPFKPRLSLRLKGGTKRGQHPALTAVLSPRPGDANIASISVALPRSEFLDQSHIRTVCTRVQFAADACPPAAVYGHAVAQTPLLDYPLAGPVYLRSSDNLLPDLVPDLRGPASQPVKLEAAGRTDTVRGALRNTFDFIPDAPVTRVVLSLPGGGKGLLVNSRDICAEANLATARYTAHNGRTFVARPTVQAKCGGKKGKAKRRGDRRAHRPARSSAGG